MQIIFDEDAKCYSHAQEVRLQPRMIIQLCATEVAPPWVYDYCVEAECTL